MFLLIIYFSLFVLALVDNSRGPVYPDILEMFDITSSTGALFFTLSSIFTVIAALSSNKIIKKFGLYLSFRIYLLVFCGAILLLANAQNLFLLFASASLMGFAVGGLGITQNSMVPLAVSEPNKKRAFSGLHSMYAFASLLAPVFVNLWEVNISHWQNWFLFLFIFPLLIMFIPKKIVLNSTQLFKVKKQTNKEIQKEINNTSNKNQGVFLLGLIMASYVCAELIVSTRIVLYSQEVFEFTKESSRNLLTLFFVFLLTGRVLSSFIDLKISYKKMLQGSFMLSVMFFALGVYISPYFLSFTGMTMSIVFPSVMAWASEIFPDNLEKAMSSIMLAIGLALSVIHYAFGLLATHLNLVWAMMLGVFSLLVAVVALQLFKPLVEKPKLSA